MRKLLCRLIGHDWFTSKYGGPLNHPWATQYRCNTCGENRDLED